MSIFSEIFLNNFEIKKNNMAIVSGKCSLSYEDLLKRIYSAKKYYEECGVSKGKRVIIFMENCPEFTISFMALNICGAIVIPIYVKVGREKLQDICNFYCPDYISTNSMNYETLLPIKPLISSYMAGVFIHADNGKLEMDSYGGKSVDIPVDNDITVILSSSGTTSDPKGIMLTDENITSNSSAIAKYMEIDRDDRIYMVKSINHSSSITGELLVGLYAGCTIYIHTGLVHARLLLELMKKNKISVFFAVPTILNDIVRYMKTKTIEISSLRIIHFYGAVMNNSDMNALIDNFKDCELIYAYGLTEASPRVTYAKRERLLSYPGTSGIALPAVTIRIEYEEDNASHEEPGEIVVKGPNVMRGYFKNPSLTQKVLRNGELYTGDLGHIDENGNLYVMGRKDNMIIKNGRNVFPEEIERVISLFDSVSEVLVTELNEAIIAYIVSEQETINEKNLIAFCRQKLEDYKVPDRIVKVPELKKNSNNKLVRNVRY